jgi:flagellar biosynthesis protein FlhB
MSDNQQDKTEQPTTKKLKKAREEGQVARSKDFTSGILVTASGIALLIFTPFVADFFRSSMENQMRLEREMTRSPEKMIEVLGETITELILQLSPLLFVLFILMFFASLFPGGLVFSKKSLQPQFSKLNPLSGLKRMFSSQSLMELTKSLLKATLIFGSLVFFLYAYRETFLLMSRQAFNASMTSGLNILSLVISVMGAVLMLIALIDIPYQYKAMIKKLKMSKQEIKDEHKNAEGSPETKRRIRQIQIQQSKSAINRQVPLADVVIVNPTHYSVALKYDDKRAKAPFVVAKGLDDIALHIRQVAKKHQVHILSAPNLTRALYHSTKVDQEVPSPLYTAVALVLTHVMNLKAYQAGVGSKPKALPSLSIPDNFKQSD